MRLWREWLLKYGYNVELDDYMFKSNRGGHITEDLWYKTVTRNCKLAGIKQPILVLMDEDVKITLEVYNHVNQERMDNEMDKINDYTNSYTNLTRRYS